MPVKLYYFASSPPVRAVMYTLKSLNVPYEVVDINLFQGDQFSEKFLQFNPQHTVPTIEDEDGFTIGESHAINVYLVNKYGKDDKLYPKDLKSRAIVDQRLHFDNGVLYMLLKTYIVQAALKKAINKVTDDMVELFEEAYDFLENFLKGNQFVAGNNITIADFSILTSLTNASVLLPLDSKKYPLITDYMKRCEAKIPGFKKLENEAKQALIQVLKSANFELN